MVGNVCLRSVRGIGAVSNAVRADLPLSSASPWAAANAGRAAVTAVGAASIPARAVAAAFWTVTMIPVISVSGARDARAIYLIELRSYDVIMNVSQLTRNHE